MLLLLVLGLGLNFNDQPECVGRHTSAMILLTGRPLTILIQLLTYFLYNDLIPVTLTLRVRENIVLHTFTVSSLVWDSREDSDSGNRQTRKQTSTKRHIHPHNIRRRRTVTGYNYQYHIPEPEDKLLPRAHAYKNLVSVSGA